MAISPLSVDTRYCEIGLNPYTSMWGTSRNLYAFAEYCFFGYEYDHLHFGEDVNNKRTYQWVDDYVHPTEVNKDLLVNLENTFFNSKGLRDLYIAGNQDNPASITLYTARTSGRRCYNALLVTSPAYINFKSDSYKVYMNSALNFAPVVQRNEAYSYTGDGFWIYVDTYIGGKEPNKPYINEDCLLERGYKTIIDNRNKVIKIQEDVDNTRNIIATARTTINNDYASIYNRGYRNYNNIKSYISSVSFDSNLNIES